MPKNPMIDSDPVKETRRRAALKKMWGGAQGEWKLKKAFKELPFIYGTQGGGTNAVKAAQFWRDRLQTANRPDHRAASQARISQDPSLSEAEKRTRLAKIADGGARTAIFQKLDLFEPGTRVKSYLKQGYQMMDMYYGPSLTAQQEVTYLDDEAKFGLHALRNPSIAEFVHHAMGFTAPFSMQKSGRQAYFDHFKTSVEGWRKADPNCPRYGTLWPTAEMSAIIRWGIANFGGTLVFEGRDVFYEQVFVPGTYQGDTDLEAMDLFEYFTKGQPTAKFGNGRIVFQWGGNDTTPTRTHFLTNWKAYWNGKESGVQAWQAAPQIKHVRAPGEKGAVTDKGGTMHAHTANNRPTNDFFVSPAHRDKADFSGNGFRPIWNNFSDIPFTLQGRFTEKEIIEALFGDAGALGKVLRRGAW
jgi:hypothetical protein